MTSVAGKKDKAIVLLSSGLDSSVNLYWAMKELDVQLALTFQYGQRAAVKEVEKSKKICAELGIAHKVLDITWVKEFGSSSLIDEQLSIPTGASVEIDSYDVSMKTMKSVWVPNRNGIFLNIAAGFAEAMQATYVIPGFNLEEASTFPDNSEDYMKSLDASFSFSTQNKIKVKCFTVQMQKPEIARKAIELKVNWANVWPCYFEGDQWCGVCESCKRSVRALQLAKVDLKDLVKNYEV